MRMSDLLYTPPKDDNVYSDEQLLQLALTAPMTYRNQGNALWIRAFKSYNLKNQRIGMSCGSCYGKVLAYLLKIRLENKQ
jgi:hypothetical protein